MASNPAIIKGTKDGLRIILDPEIPFGTIVSFLEEKFQANPGFFSGAVVTLEYGGRKLSREEQTEIQELIARNNLLLTETDDGRDEIPTMVKNNPGSDETLFLFRAVRSGQTVTYPGHIVVVGDVNPGSKLIAGGNIVVLGNLRGVAHAGAAGDEGAVVAAYRLQPTQLRIGDIISRPPDGPEEESHIPEVASIKDGFIVIEPYNANRSWQPDKKSV